MRLLLILSLASGMSAAVPCVAASQSRDTVVGPQTRAPLPACCSIVRIETTQSIVVARETGTGFTFRFGVKNRRLLGTLKIGQPVWADFAAKTVKLKATDAQPCCAIVDAPQPPPSALGGRF
jgi:hypothetical protein